MSMDRIINLTALEIETMRLVSQGYSSREIASLCYRTPKTIEKRILGIKNKLFARNIAHAASIFSAHLYAKENSAAQNSR